jgi:hypothetical protein
VPAVLTTAATFIHAKTRVAVVQRFPALRGEFWDCDVADSATSFGVTSFGVLSFGVLSIMASFFVIR